MHKPYANQILAWEKHLLSEVRELFQCGSSLSGETGRQIQKLQAKVGELTMEINFLSSAFAKTANRHITPVVTSAVIE